MDFVHQMGMIHRDIKIENVLIAVDPRTKIKTYKLCDFGSVSMKVINYGTALNKEQMAIVQSEIDKQTTPAYRAPELIDLYLRMGIDNKIDIWVNKQVF